jgi:Lon-like ATP-dependent protease
MSDFVCKYIFKKGDKKGNECGIINCSKHHLKKKLHKPHKIIKQKLIVIQEETNLEQVIKKQILTNDNIKHKILNLDTNIENKSVIMKHYHSLCKLDTNTTEYYKHRSYVDYSLNVPWNKYYNIEDRIKDISIKDFIMSIKKEFDKCIYGMDNVKNEIINYICKFISNPNSQKNNLALYGSAGVCKTKFVKILSDILNLPVRIIPLGGVKDSSFFMGHNFTYVESNYGIIMQSIIDSKIMNPILYFDELDKVSQADTGKDIYSVLSNLTDNTVNTIFTDHYFRGMQFDLSKVFYIFTFNDISKIDKVLLDRLNVIHVETPSKKDRAKILSEYCLNDIIQNIGMKSIKFEYECYTHLINYVDSVIDIKISSGIRESIRILEKILLEINKEILCEINIQVDFIDFNKYLIYFNKLKSQFLLEQNVNLNSFMMYM